MIQLCVVIALLVPASVRFAGVSLFDIAIYSTIFVSFFQWMLKTNSILKIKVGVETTLCWFLAITILSYVFNSFTFDNQKDFVESLGMSFSYLFLRLCLYGVATVVMLLGVHRIVTEHLTSSSAMRTIVNTILGAGFINAAITIVVWYTETGGEFDRYNYLPPLEESQGVHVACMTLVFVLAFGFLKSQVYSTRTGRNFLIGVLLLTGFNIFTVWVRLGWVIFALTNIFYYYLSDRKRAPIGGRFSMYFLLIVLGISGAIAIFTNESGVLTVFSEISDLSINENAYSSVYSRYVLIEQGFSLFQNHYLAGIGYGHYPAYSTTPVIVSGIETFVSSPHNGIVTMLAETGMIGTAFYFWLCWCLLVGLVKSWKQTSCKVTSVVTTAALSVMIIEIFGQFFGNGNILPVPTERAMVQFSFLFWLLCSLSIGSSRKEATDTLKDPGIQ